MGLGKEVQEIMDEANITDTMNSAEFTCFERLYEDALRRQRKQREIERMKLGLGPKDVDNRPGTLQRGAGGVVGFGSAQGMAVPQIGGAFPGYGGSPYAIDPSYGAGGPIGGSYGGRPERDDFG